MILAVIAAARFFLSASGRFFAFSFVYPSPSLPSPTARQSAISRENRSMSSSSFVFATPHATHTLPRIGGSEAAT